MKEETTSIRVPKSLAYWLHVYAVQEKTTMTAIITAELEKLKNAVETAK